MPQERLQLIVYTRKTGVQQKLSQMGNVIYISKRMNYVCLYIDAKMKDKTINRIKSLHGVSRIEIGPQVLSSALSDEKHLEGEA
ncbi:MAG: YlbG family protein [Turicibacter sp.]|nr:YlbG family protein [Turicibacter sp.]